MHPRRRLQRIIDETMQMIRDCQYWNKINPAERPIDCEPERVMLRLATDAADEWDAGRIDDSQTTMKKLTAYAESLGE